LFGPDNTHDPNEAQRAGAGLAQHVFLPALLVRWAWAYAFTAKARTYFRRPTAEPE